MGAAQGEPHRRAQGGGRIPVFRPPDGRSRNESISESAYHPPGDMDPVIEPGGPVRRSRSGVAGRSTIRRRDTIKQLDPSSRRY